MDETCSNMGTPLFVQWLYTGASTPFLPPTQMPSIRIEAQLPKKYQVIGHKLIEAW